MRFVPDDLPETVFLSQVHFLSEVALLAWLRQAPVRWRRWRFDALCRHLKLYTSYGTTRYTLAMWAANKLSYRGVVETGWRQPNDHGGGSQRWVSLVAGQP